MPLLFGAITAAIITAVAAHNGRMDIAVDWGFS